MEPNSQRIINGRETDARRIVNELIQNKRVYLLGMPGVGKSTLVEKIRKILEEKNNKVIQIDIADAFQKAAKQKTEDRLESKALQKSGYLKEQLFGVLKEENLFDQDQNKSLLDKYTLNVDQLINAGKDSDPIIFIIDHIYEIHKAYMESFEIADFEALNSLIKKITAVNFSYGIPVMFVGRTYPEKSYENLYKQSAYWEELYENKDTRIAEKLNILRKTFKVSDIASRREHYLKPLIYEEIKDIIEKKVPGYKNIKFDFITSLYADFGGVPSFMVEIWSAFKNELKIRAVKETDFLKDEDLFLELLIDSIELCNPKFESSFAWIWENWIEENEQYSLKILIMLRQLGIYNVKIPKAVVLNKSILSELHRKGLLKRKKNGKLENSYDSYYVFCSSFEDWLVNEQLRDDKAVQRIFHNESHEPEQLIQDTHMPTKTVTDSLVVIEYVDDVIKITNVIDGSNYAQAEFTGHVRNLFHTLFKHVGEYVTGDDILSSLFSDQSDSRKRNHLYTIKRNLSEKLTRFGSVFMVEKSRKIQGYKLSLNGNFEFKGINNPHLNNDGYIET